MVFVLRVSCWAMMVESYYSCFWSWQFHLEQLHLQRSVHSRFAFPHEQELQFPLQVHLMSSLVHFPTSGIVIQTGTQLLSSLFQPKFDGQGSSGCDEDTIQIPKNVDSRLEDVTILFWYVTMEWCSYLS